MEFPLLRTYRYKRSTLAHSFKYVIQSRTKCLLYISTFPFTSLRRIAGFMAQNSSLFPRLTWRVQRELPLGISAIQKSKHKRRYLFKDAFLPVCFWVQSISLVLGLPRSLSLVFWSHPYCIRWFMSSLQNHDNGNIEIVALFSSKSSHLSCSSFPVFLQCMRQLVFRVI